MVINIEEVNVNTLLEKQKIQKNKELSKLQYSFMHNKSVIELQEIFETRFEHHNIKKV